MKDKDFNRVIASLEDAIAYLREIVRRTDSSLLTAWENRTNAPAAAAAREAERVAPKRKRERDLANEPKALRARVRAELRALAQALAEGDYDAAARSIPQAEGDPWDAARFAEEMRPYLEEHGELRFDAAAYRGHHTALRLAAPRLFRVQHTLLNAEGEEQGFIEGEVDLQGALDPEGPLVRVLGIRA